MLCLTTVVHTWLRDDPIKDDAPVSLWLHCLTLTPDFTGTLLQESSHIQPRRSSYVNGSSVATPSRSKSRTLRVTMELGHMQRLPGGPVQVRRYTITPFLTRYTRELTAPVALLGVSSPPDPCAGPRR